MKLTTFSNGLRLQISLWILILLLIPFTYPFRSGDLNEDAVEKHSPSDQVDEDQELETQMLPTDDDKDSSDTSKPEFVTSPAALSIQVEEEGNAPMTTDESGHDGEALNDAGSNPTPIIPLEAHTLNSSINSNDTNNNETKPLRTVAFCALNPELVQVEEETLTLTLLPIISEREDFPLNSNESSAELESAGTESSSSVEGPSSESGTENEAEAPMPGTPSLRLVNMSELIQDVLWSNNSIKSRVIPANCSIVLFYASWCPFSAKAAPHFNALPRAFPSLRVAAIDVSSQSAVNSYFGILSVPTVILFHNGKSVAKFNESSFSLNKFAEFVHTHTDLRSDENINVTSHDFTGPLPSVPTRGVDIYLILAWVFISACFLYYVTKSTLWRRAIDLVRTTWREAEDHVHQD